MQNQLVIYLEENKWKYGFSQPTDWMYVNLDNIKERSLPNRVYSFEGNEKSSRFFWEVDKKAKEFVSDLNKIRSRDIKIEDISTIEEYYLDLILKKEGDLKTVDSEK